MYFLFNPIMFLFFFSQAFYLIFTHMQRGKGKSQALMTENKLHVRISVPLYVCVCLMYKSSEPEQALINGVWWLAGKGKQQLNELAPLPSISEDNCISATNLCGRHAAFGRASLMRMIFPLFRALMFCYYQTHIS